MPSLKYLSIGAGDVGGTENVVREAHTGVSNKARLLDV